MADGSVAPGLDCDELAAFLVSSLQGAHLLTKTERAPDALDRLKRILFGLILQARTGGN